MATISNAGDFLKDDRGAKVMGREIWKALKAGEISQEEAIAKHMGYNL